MEQLGKAAVLSTPPTSRSHHLTATATTKKKWLGLHYVETSCTDGIRSNTARIRTGKITCYSFVFGTLTIEDHIVVLEIFPLLVPFWVFMQHHTHGLPRKCRRQRYLWKSHWQPGENKEEDILANITAAPLRLIHHINHTQLSRARRQRKQRSSDLVLPNVIRQHDVQTEKTQHMRNSKFQVRTLRTHFIILSAQFHYRKIQDHRFMLEICHASPPSLTSPLGFYPSLTCS